MTERLEPADVEDLIALEGFLALDGRHLAADRVAGDAFVRSVADHQTEHPAVVNWIETQSTRL
ncbi:hypothetical protein E3O19_13235 [Cryobacterium algoritolerans]|uniref:Uncharacterized protein n=1 Tax=Cryobacterium algoritolerans TaxID=1259184 RepID=A0A4R8WLM7_9MICO|nr:hypothetical protein [Cryobacterium algoritolerans]TFC12440.1 hypothetical protein E3O19_13235 [Cryobacterium algoritolerans]